MMICSASRGDDLKLTKKDFTKAIGMLTAVEVNMSKTFGGLGKSRTSDSTETVMGYIKAVGYTTRQQILSRFYRDVDPMTLGIIEQTLQQMGVLKIILIPNAKGGPDKSYEWIGGQ